MAKIPTTVVTGFLGSGKTTLVRSLLERANGRKLAVIVNEFGDVGIDGEILRGCGIESCADDDIVELANGCICCTVADDFLPTMKKLVERPDPPEHILVETSGLALPKPLVKAFTWPEVRTRATVDGVIAMIDADAVARGRFAADEAAVAAARAQDPTLDHETPLEELFEEQIGCADLVILNKMDLVADADRPAVEAAVREHLRPGAQVIFATQGEVAAAAVLGLGIGAEDDLDSRPSHHEGAADDHDHDDFESLVVAGPATASAERLATALAPVIAAHDILRLKGVVAVEGKPARLIVQAVGPRIQSYFDRPWRDGEARQSRLVVIGERGLDRAAIEPALAAALG
ncbi:MAG: cobalamin biosynthesis protein CobW [Phenylobacterium zucineum]|nr:MAG: cobalamin biosynthesis protein CobW [Phenylobacterium zucineum]